MITEVASWNSVFVLWFSFIFLSYYIEIVHTDIRFSPVLHRRYLTGSLTPEVVESSGPDPMTDNGNSVEGDGQAWGPTDNNTVTNVTVQLGVTAYLHCRTHALALQENVRHVSWVRRRDWHILSSGVFTYTNDERFQIMHSDASQDWLLKIRYVQKRDNGTYECQVSTGTGLISHLVNLRVVVPEAFIEGTAERHVDVGSVISLVCVIQKSPTPPQYVFWYHGERMINYDTSRRRSGITVETLPGAQTQSRLTIRDTHDADTGNYTCSAANTQPASIYVFVEEGDKMASLRKKSSAVPLLHWWSFPLTMFSILFNKFVGSYNLIFYIDSR